MNTENDKYTEPISRIKASQPILYEPQKLTSTIMQRIEPLSKRKTYKEIRHCGLDPQSTKNSAFNKEMLKQVQHDGGVFRKSHNKILKIVSVTSSIAASLLIGLFIFEQSLPLENNEYKSSTITSILPVAEKNVYIEKPTSLSELNNLIRAKKEQQIFYSNIINNHKTF